MKLYVDAGNSRIKWCDDEMLADGECHVTTHDALDVLSNDKGARPDAVWISSVAGEAFNRQLAEGIRHIWGVAPNFVETKSSQLGVVNGYRRAGQLGVDRWMALIATHALFQRPMIVVDCGSATTIDAIRADGNHLGGLILPGITMMQQTLISTTAMADPDERPMLADFATDTASGIRSAAIHATTALIERSMRCYNNLLGQEASCLLTGGNARLVQETLAIQTEHQPNLVLHGVALTAAES